MGLIRSIACAFLCVLCLDSWTDGLFSSCSAQQVDNQSKRIPYQRVFIPSDDLTSIGIEEFVPIDVKRLEELIDRHSNNAIANTPSKLRDDQGGVTLISSFYVAKLVGADLLSERSRLSFSGTARWGERVALRPWSLAVQPPTVAGVRPDSQTLPNWSFDASGIPRISMVPNEPSGIQPNAVPNSLISLFGWSSKAAADSTTNNLKFSVEVPKCANSCLVLALPPQAVIQDCTTVVKRLEDWSAIALRLNDWEDFAKLPLEQNLVRSPESLWLIELGGSSVFSFSIELGINRSKEDTLSETQPFKHLIPSQKVEHFIEEEMIRTTCEAAIAGSPQQMVRFRLATGARIRRLAVNQQDVEWEVEEGWIRWRLGGGASPARTEDVFVEFFSPLLADNQSLFELPRIVFDRSYVMVGTESVQCDPSWKLTHSECDTGRLSERPTDFKSGSVSKIEYAWSANPPSHIVGLKRSPAERRSEFLTRLSNDPKKTTATVRARLSFAEQDANHVSFAVAPNWQIVSVQSLDPKDSITVQSKVDPENATALNLNWGRLLKSRVADIEIHLHRLADSPPDTMRRLAILPLVQSIGWTRTDTIVVEDSPVFDFQLHDSLLDAMVAEESISDWQKTYLPRTDKHFVFRYDSSNSPLGATQASPIALEWREAPNRLQTSLTTEVDKINDSTLLARHEIQLRLGADANAFVSITLPFRNAYWRLKQEGKWIPLNPLASSTALADPSTGVWQFDSKQLGQECTLMAVVQSDISAEREVTFRMPQVSNANILSHEVRSLGSDIAIHCVVAGSQWEIDPRGNKFLALPHSGKPVDLVARVSKSIPSQKWLAVDSELHIAVDSIGSQRACLLLRSHTSAQTEMTVELAEGWDTMAVFSSHAGKPKRVLYRVDETDGRRLILMPESHPEGELEIQMELIGPRLAKKFSLVSLGQTFLFEWPKIQTQAATLLEQRVLWLPGDLQRNTSEEKGLIWDKERERWPVWTWWKSMVASLNGSTKSTAVPLPMRHLAAAYGLVPGWVSSDWRIAFETSGSTDGSATEGFGKHQEIVSIGAAGADRAYLALLFVLFALVTPRLLLSGTKIVTGTALFLICCATMLPEVLTKWAYTGLIGMSTGFGVFVVYRLLAKPTRSDGSVSQKRSAKWPVWGDREVDRGSSISQGSPSSQGVSSIGNFRSLGLFLAIVSGFGCDSLPLASNALGQSKLSDGTAESQARVHQIVIPMDDAGNLVGTSVYVPAEMLNALDGKRAVDRGTQRIAARYGLRVGARGRVFSAADQIIMVYDFLVGDDLEAVRFPINVSQLQFPRFSLDGIELSIGPKLRNNGSEWVWTPDKAGRRTIQIVAQPVLKSNDSDRNRESIIQSVDIAILPIANAQLDVETDVQNSVDVVTRGRLTDPAPGRFVAMLGAVDRLQCNFNTPIVKSSSFSNPSANVSESTDAPVMNTELFLQGDILQAKTIVEFPKGISTGPEIEIEADSQWIPVGTHWGDAEWVDTRSGSTLGRRRYVLEWKSSQGGTVQASARDRQISVIWVPQPSCTSLNILFAECRDRRTRRGTLRYARAFDANWSLSLDGINAWIPAIGSKDRLDWPTANPIATSLRIPPNGGFGGVLKHKVPLDRPQARVTTKWVVNPNRESLTSVIELRGGSSSHEPLVVDLPGDFSVSELYNENGPVRFLQSRHSNRLRVQVLADRKSLEASFLILQAKRQELRRPRRFAEDQRWQELPWIVLSNNINSDQKLEVTAAENVVLQWESDPNLLVGKGLNAPILNLEKSYSDIYSNTLASKRCRIAARDEPISGRLTLRLNSGVSPVEIEVLGEFEHSVFSRPGFVLEVPSSLKDRLQNNTRTRSMACPDPSKAWLQVLLPENPLSLDLTAVSTVVRFVSRSEDIASDLELMRNIRPLDQELISVVSSELPLVEKSEENAGGQIHAPNTAEEVQNPSIANWMLRIRNNYFQSNASERFVLLESEFWVAESNHRPNLDRILEWQLRDEAELLSILVDGVPVDFTQEGQRVRCFMERAGLCAEVVLFSKHRVLRDSEGRMNINAIEWAGRQTNVEGPLLLASHVGELSGNRLTVLVSNAAVPEKQISMEIQGISQSCLELIESTMERIPDLRRIEPSSDLARWKGYWNKKAKRYLEAWSTTSSSIDQAAFGSTVSRWHTTSNDSPTEPNFKPQHSTTFLMESDPNNPTLETQPNTRLFSLFGCLLILLSIHMLVPVWPWLQKHPWWCLIGLGFFAWVVSGDLLPALVLGGIGLFVAADSYWILTARLRRNGTRGQRSL